MKLTVWQDNWITMWVCHITYATFVALIRLLKLKGCIDHCPSQDNPINWKICQDKCCGVVFFSFGICFVINNTLQITCSSNHQLLDQRQNSYDRCPTEKRMQDQLGRNDNPLTVKLEAQLLTWQDEPSLLSLLQIGLHHFGFFSDRSQIVKNDKAGSHNE